MEYPTTRDEAKKLGFDSIANYKLHMAGKLARGLKYKNLKAKAEFEGKTETLKWINSQESVLDDIKTYEESLEAPKEVVEEEVKEETKSKKRK